MVLVGSNSHCPVSPLGNRRLPFNFRNEDPSILSPLVDEESRGKAIFMIRQFVRRVSAGTDFTRQSKQAVPMTITTSRTILGHALTRLPCANLDNHLIKKGRNPYDVPDWWEPKGEV